MLDSSKCLIGCIYICSDVLNCFHIYPAICWFLLLQYIARYDTTNRDKMKKTKEDVSY